MTSINDIQDEIIEEFSLFDNPQDKYTYLIDLGKKVEALEAEDKTEDNIVKGCQSQVWLTADFQEELLHYHADSDAMIVRGLVSLLLRVLSGHSPKEIVEADLYFVDKIGLKQMLSMTRSNGLAAMMKKMKMYALAYQTKLQAAE
ncbi:MAG: SufE family protein [Bacteroidota bacterium]